VSIAWFDGLTVTAEIAFASDPLSSAPVWTDVTAYLRSWIVDRGRTTEYDTFSPGTATVTFANADRRFDPEYAAGPYFGNLRPMKRIRLSLTYSGTTYRRFTGFILGWPQTYEYPSVSWVTVSCVDGCRFLENSLLAGTAYEAAVRADAPAFYFPCQAFDGEALRDEIGGQLLVLDGNIAATAANLAGRIVTDPALTDPTARIPPGTAPLNAAAHLAATATIPSDVSFLFTGYRATTWLASAVRAIEAWVTPQISPSTGLNQAYVDLSVNAGAAGYMTVRVGMTSSTSKTVNLTVGYAHTADNRSLSTTIITGLQLSGMFHVVVFADTTNLYVYVNNELRQTLALSVGSVASTSYTDIYHRVGLEGEYVGVAHVAAYTTVPSTTRFAAHYFAGTHAWGHPTGEMSGARIGRVLDEIGWPAGLRDLDTGSTPHGPYEPAGRSALEYLRLVEAAEQGFVFLAGDGTVTLVDRSAILTSTATYTFSDDGSDTPYVDVVIDSNSVHAIRNKVRVTFGERTRDVSDSTSVTAYGPAQDTITADTLESGAVAGELANYRLRLSKDPQTRIEQLKIAPRARPATAIPATLNLELGARANVERTPQGVGSAIDKDVLVQGLHEQLDVDGTWNVDVYCSPAPANYVSAPYLRLGDATYGRIGAVAGNRVPY
jgi:hypothetical protein